MDNYFIEQVILIYFHNVSMNINEPSWNCLLLKAQHVISYILLNTISKKVPRHSRDMVFDYTVVNNENTAEIKL